MKYIEEIKYREQKDLYVPKKDDASWIKNISNDEKHRKNVELNKEK